MKTLNRIFAVSFLAVFLAVACAAQQQGAQTLSTTTLSSALTNVGAGNISSITLASLTNVTATVSIGTRLWVDTEAMDVVTNSVPASGTTILVQRGASGTKAEGHLSGRTVYVSRPNLYQGYDQAGTCWTSASGSGLPVILPWINLTDGAVFDCKSDGNWFRAKTGSQWGAAITAATGFCTGTVTSAATIFLNGAACTGTTATYQYIASTGGEVTALNVGSTAVVVGGSSLDVLTVFKNGVATALTCTIAAAGKTCSDTTHGFIVAAGDVLTFQFVAATSDTAANVAATVGIYGN